MKFESKMDLSEFRKNLRKHEKNVIVRARRLAELIAHEVREYAVSHSGTKKGAAINAAGNYIPKNNRTMRQKHPGEWADITGNLANSIQGRVQSKGFTMEAIIEATMEYAEDLDALTGYSVLGGADVIARKALKKYGKELFGD